MQLNKRKILVGFLALISQTAFALSTVDSYTPELDNNGTAQTGRQQVIIQEQTSNAGCGTKTTTTPAVTEQKRVCEIIGWEDEEYDLSDWENKAFCRSDGGRWVSKMGQGYCESCSVKTVVVKPASTTTKMVCS
ncbi:hypothetical protein [Vibrio alginolyticus]|uniref:hypothetical protein n=1 Tax=Vibrio alginolyticus TaxID=663 RepID=UPI0006CAA1A6|nr:hypothetical protein [Vibrio alginolyticus]KPM98724.1 hypothetical protein AOG25_10005 [Vibrio alginolyticus]